MTNINNDILKHIGGIECNNLKNILEDFDITKHTTHEHFITSSYYDFEGTVATLSGQANSFITMTLNIEGLRAKFDKLTAFLSMLADNYIAFDAICLQGTWLSDSETTNYDIFNIPGYNLIPQGYKCGKKGGLIIYLREHFTYSIRKLYKDSKHWEGLFIDITSENLPRKITLANIYRPPRDNYSNSSIDNFLSPISEIINVTKNENSTLLWSGDFNINLLQIETRGKFQEYFDLFTSNGLFPQIMLPTRLSKKRGTLIDQIFCKLSGTSTNATSGIIVNNISDHLPCFSCINILNNKTKAPKYVTTCNTNANAIHDFKEEVRTQIDNTKFENDLLLDPNINY